MNRKDCDKLKGITRRSNRRCAWAFVLVVWATPALGDTVSLWREAVVTGDQVRIADVCRLRGMDATTRDALGELVVREAPQVGGSIVVTVDEIRQTLAAGEANLASIVLKGAATCDVTRPRRSEVVAEVPANPSSSKTVPASRNHVASTLRNAIEVFLQDDLDVPGSKVQLKFGRNNGGVLDLSEPEYMFEIERSTGRRLGLVGLNITVLSKGESVQEVPMLVDVSFTKPTVVATRAVNVGAKVGPNDVRLVDMTFDRRERIGADDPAAIIGQQAKRFIPAGHVVSIRDLEPVPLVKRGQVVSVYSSSGGVSIVTAAKALTSGTYGQTVELRAGDRSKDQFTATVAGPGRVRVGVASDEALAMGGVQ